MSKDVLTTWFSNGISEPLHHISGDCDEVTCPAEGLYVVIPIPIPDAVIERACQERFGHEWTEYPESVKEANRTLSRRAFLMALTPDIV